MAKFQLPIKENQKQTILLYEGFIVNHQTRNTFIISYRFSSHAEKIADDLLGIYQKFRLCAQNHSNTD
jgi:hypothetical protein